LESAAILVCIVRIPWTLKDLLCVCMCVHVCGCARMCVCLYVPVWLHRRSEARASCTRFRVCGVCMCACVCVYTYLCGCIGIVKRALLVHVFDRGVCAKVEEEVHYVAKPCLACLTQKTKSQNPRFG